MTSSFASTYSVGSYRHGVAATFLAAAGLAALLIGEALADGKGSVGGSGILTMILLALLAAMTVVFAWTCARQIKAAVDSGEPLSLWQVAEFPAFGIMMTVAFVTLGCYALGLAETSPTARVLLRISPFFGAPSALACSLVMFRKVIVSRYD